MIHFDQQRWANIARDYSAWWAGDLKRPLIYVSISGADPGRPEPAIPPVRRETTSYNLAVTPEAIVDRWDYDLSGLRFLGDGFPGVWLDFGPGVIAAFLGAKPEPGVGTIWFHPDAHKEIADLHFTFDPDNIWYRRIQDINRAALQRWEGLVQVSMTDLGGNLDILSTFRPSEELLYDLYDTPDEVKRLTWEAHDAWWQYFDAFNNVLQPVNPGYTAWTQIFSTEPYYILQCDFCYMIGPDMFDEFVKPELAACCRRLTNSFYHLDGIGQLPHLDSLLQIEELKGVQWVPGDGKPPQQEWPEVLRKIQRAGKRLQLWGSLDMLPKLEEELGTLENVILFSNAHVRDQAEVEEILRKYGAM